MSVVFLSYRRKDSPDVTGRIYDRLVAKYAKNRVFRDIDNMPLGITFPLHLKKVLGKCDVVLVIIGPNWLTAKDEQGRRRLDDPSDIVRVEIEVALRANMAVIPVLVANASMPRQADLPRSIRSLAMRSGTHVRPEPDFGRDMEGLIRGIEEVLDLGIRRKRTSAGKPQKSRPPSSPKPADGSGCGMGISTFLTVLFVLSGVAAAAFWFSNVGMIRIQLDPPQAQVQVKIDDRAFSVADLDRPLRLRAEEHRLLVTGPDFETVSGSFTVMRGDNPPMRVPLVPKEDALIREMKFVRLPKGTAYLGGGLYFDDKAKALKRYEPTEEVPIDYDVELAAFCVTQEQWQKLMGNNPSTFSHSGKYSEYVKNVSADDLKRFPVENVSWNDVKEFLNKLNAQQKEKRWRYRLPKAVEWEYGCRGAASKEDSSWDFYVGKQKTNDLSSDDANFNGDFPAGDAKKRKNLGRPQVVGRYASNELGLHDMHGNVWQWCEDELWKGKEARRAGRGGSWLSKGEVCRASVRSTGAPEDHDHETGFRIARVPSKE
jgi:formylglycine-generating enzyme required for sulfatase activity